MPPSPGGWSSLGEAEGAELEVCLALKIIALTHHLLQRQLLHQVAKQRTQTNSCLYHTGTFPVRVK